MSRGVVNGITQTKMAIPQNLDFRDNFRHSFVNILGGVIFYVIL